MQQGDKVRLQIKASIEVEGEIVGEAANGIVVRVNRGAAGVQPFLPGDRISGWMEAAGADLAADFGNLVWIGAAHISPPTVTRDLLD